MSATNIYIYIYIYIYIKIRLREYVKEQLNLSDIRKQSNNKLTISTAAINTKKQFEGKFRYSTDIQFLHQSTGRMPVPDCTNTYGLTCKKYPKRINAQSKLQIKVRSEYRVAIGRAVVKYSQTARTFTAEIKCRHCMYQTICEYGATNKVKL